MSKTTRANAAMKVALTLIVIFAVFGGVARSYEQQAICILCIFGVIALVVILAFLRIF